VSGRSVSRFRTPARSLRSDPDLFFVPPYVGYRGWVGVRFDGDPDWDQVEKVVPDAYDDLGRKR
jgi:hypothetical protein